MQSFLQKGEVLDLTAPASGVISGQFFKVGDMIVCAQAAADEGDPVAGVTEGVFDDAPKDSTVAFTEGEKIYWDDSAKKFTDASSSNTAAGYALEVAATGVTTAKILLKWW